MDSQPPTGRASPWPADEEDLLHQRGPMTGLSIGLPDGAVLLLGASGQIGRCLLRRLAADRRPVIAVCRRPLPALAPEAEWLIRDLARALDLGDRRPVAAIHATGAWLLPLHLPALAAAGVKRLICF